MSENNNPLQTRSDSDEITPEIHHLPRVSPPVDIFENEHGYMIRADVPGVSESDVIVRFDRGELVFEAKRIHELTGTIIDHGFGSVLFRRAFRIPEAIDADKISAHIQHGVLELNLPKAEEVRPRQIAVTAG